MNMIDSHRNVPVTKGLHPRVYAILGGSVAWFMFVVWIFFGRNTYTAIQLAAATVFAVVFVAVPAALWRLSRREQDESMPFSEWSDSDFDTFTGKVHGAHAAIMVLLAPLACAMGITGVSLIGWLVATGAL